MRHCVGKSSKLGHPVSYSRAVARGHGLGALDPPEQRPNQASGQSWASAAVSVLCLHMAQGMDPVKPC